MENKNTPLKHYESEVITYLKDVTKSKKLSFTFSDAIKFKELGNNRIKVLIEAIEFINSNPLRDNDYYKYINSYLAHGIKLKDKYFRHDLKKLNEYYTKIDNDKIKWNPFRLELFESYVLFMTLKLECGYTDEDNTIFNVNTIDFREYNPLTKIPSVLRGCLPFNVIEYDIKRAFPTFIDIELNTDFKDEIYSKISKSNFAMFLNANNQTSITLEDARKGLYSIYEKQVNKVITDKRYNEKGRAFKDFAKYESQFIDKFVKSNEVEKFARLHDGIFVLDLVECENLKFGKVEFAIKESIKPEIVNNTLSFYYLDDDKIITSPSIYADFLKQEKFIRVQTVDDKIQLLKDTNNVVDYFNHKTDLVSFLENEINEPICNSVRNTIARDNNNVLQQSLPLLEPIKLEYYKDTKTSFGLPFLNGFYYFDEVDSLTIKRKEYTDVKGFFTPHRIQKREFKYTNEIGVFETFIGRIVAGVKEPNTEQQLNDIACFNSMLGYLIHSYKTVAETACIVLTDEGANDVTRNGGRGKSLVSVAISEVTKSMLKGGNEFVVDYIHNFADLNESYNVYVLDDVPAEFKYNGLYTNITGGINIQPKGSKGKMIEFFDSPKFLVTTNWLFRSKEDDTSTARRFIEYKIKPYYNIAHTPKIEFNQTFFEDWDLLEWNKFYSYVFRCVRSYLVNGIKKIHYDKTEDNYKASFNSDVKEAEMARIIEILIHGFNGKLDYNRQNDFFTVFDFLRCYKNYDNPLKNDQLFTQWNAKSLINLYLPRLDRVAYRYESRKKRWIKV